MVEPGLTAAYVVTLFASGATALGVGVWAYLTTDVPERRLFLGLMVVDTVWVGVAIVGLVTPSPEVTWLVLYGKALLSITAAGVWYVFATVYTGRSLRDWRTVAVLGPLCLVALVVVTNPIHHLLWSSVTYRSEPLSLFATTATPLVVLVNGWVFVTIGTGIYYVGELFVKSRHRTSLSMLVLVGGTVMASLPNVASNLGAVPVPAYDHSVFGVVAFAVAAGYAVFGLGMFDIRPVARDALVEQVDDALLVLDEQGLLVDYNAASESLSSRLATADPIGQPFEDVCPAVASALQLPASDRETSDVASLDRQGEQVHYSITATPISENGAIVGYSVVLRDVTAQIEYQQELERRNEQLDQFASAVAHDLRNPLQVAFGRANVLETSLDAETNGETAASIGPLVESLERMDDIIEDLRTLAEHGQSVEDVTEISFGTVVRNAWETVPTEEATLEVETGGTIQADRSRLLSVLENLFRNGLDHVGPSVTFRVGLTETGFYVADDGPGIPPADRERVFEYGYTDSQSGSGLGLAIVETMVSAHGWNVDVTESKAGGAAFHVDSVTTTVEPE